MADINPFLAAVYQSAEPVGNPGDDATEKLAQLDVIDKMVAAEGYNIDQIDGVTLLKVASGLFGEDNVIADLIKQAEAPPPTAEAKPEESEEEKKKKAEEAAAAAMPEEEKKAYEEKLAEADFLGRVMAHAFHQEKTALDKTALSGSQAVQAVKNWGQLAGHAATEGVAAVKDKGGKMRDAYRFGKLPLDAGGGGGRLEGLKHMAKLHPKTVAGLAGAGVLGAGGVTAAALSGSDKKASAVEMLAQMRAEEIVAAQSQQEKLAARVEQRAMEILAEQTA